MRFVSLYAVLCFVFIGLFAADGFAENGRPIAVKQLDTAQTAYDQGFAQGVMRGPDGSVRLWNHVLVEDDGPGAGTSNKGSFTEAVYGDRVIKKMLPVDDPRCAKAHVVFMTFSWGDLKKPPLVVTVNGNRAEFRYGNTEQYGYIPIDPSWLRKGENEITFACPGAKDPASGYTFLIARADEYLAGGGDPSALGKNEQTGSTDGISLIVKGKAELSPVASKAPGVGTRSLISTNGGKTWSVNGKGLDPAGIAGVSTSLFGQTNIADIYAGASGDKGGVVGEYSARLNLEQYIAGGTLVSPVIDLWAEPDKPAALIPLTGVEKLVFSFRGETPPGTKIEWQVRAGLSMDPLRAGDWSDWVPLASGASATMEPKGRVPMPPSHWDPERSVTLPKVRYLQWRAVLSTTDPLKTPSVKSVSVDRDITRRMEVPKNIMVRSWHNPEIAWSSTGFTYQSADEPMNRTVIERDDLDAIAKSASGEFDAIVKTLDYVSRRWIWGEPFVEYPKWNAVDISERIQSLGRGGMCIQFAAYLAHALTVMGFQARHMNIIAHEVVEVWSDDFDKWVYLDPTQGVDVYQYYIDSGIPLSLLDMHRVYYDMYGVKSPIDWMKQPSAWQTQKPDSSKIPVSFSTTDPRIELAHQGWSGYYPNAEFLRMMPRNDFSTTTVPEPLQQGSIQWPWDGYLNWYDELALPKLQYARHTDRACDFWPSLNRVRFEALPEINGDLLYITMITFTPSFKTFQVKVDNGAWTDSDDRYVWRLHSGPNRLEMRAVSKFGVPGAPSSIELNWVAKNIPKPVPPGSMDQ
jgi:hypothetical protein